MTLKEAEILLRAAHREGSSTEFLDAAIKVVRECHMYPYLPDVGFNLDVMGWAQRVVEEQDKRRELEASIREIARGLREALTDALEES